MEPSHADFIQGIPGAGEEANNLEMIGNRILGEEGSDGVWSQGIFLEDVAGSGTPGYYDDAIITGNIVFTGTSQGIWLYNARRAVISDNTVVSLDSVDLSDRPYIDVLTQWGYDGEDFYNCCIRVSTYLQPDVLMQRLIKIEEELGRKAKYSYF